MNTTTANNDPMRCRKLFELAIVLIACTTANGAEPASQPTAKAAARAEQLKAAIKSFRLDLSNEVVGYYDDLTLSVPVRREKALGQWRVAEVSEEQARKIIDYLATEGFLDQADEQPIKPLIRPNNSYTLCVQANDQGKDISFNLVLGWGLELRKRLDGLRNVLDGDAAKEMDKLLDRLSQQRKGRAKS